MISLMRKNMKLLGYGKFIFFMIGCLIFAVSGRIGEALQLEQHMVSAVSDHYYLTYFVIPMTLFVYLTFMEDDSEVVLIRYKNYFLYFCIKWFVGGAVPLAMVSIQTVCVWISGLGLSAGNIWRLAGNSPNTELFTVLGCYFNTPLAAFIAYTVFQFFGMWFLIGICMWIAHFAGKKQAVRIIIFLYVFSALWIKISALQSVWLTGFNHLMILHHNFGSIRRIVTTAITVFILLTCILYTVHRFWHSIFRFSLPKKKGITAYYMKWLFEKKNIIILSIVVTGILLYKGFNVIGISSEEEWIYHLFSGHGAGYFHILSFLEMLIVNGAPLYLLALFVEKAVSGQSIFVNIRSAGRKKLMSAIITAGIVFLLFYCILWLALGIAGTYFFGYALEAKALACMGYMIVLKLMDLAVQYMLMLAVYTGMHQITAGFLIMIAVNALCVIPSGMISYLPFGLSSASRLSWSGQGFGLPVATVFGILALLIMLLSLYHMKFGYKKLWR